MYCVLCTVEGVPRNASYAMCRFGKVNYEDENFNVGLPVFTVHGNHDDPAGVVRGLPRCQLASHLALWCQCHATVLISTVATAVVMA